MSKWPMRGHFGHLHFKTFPMTPRTPQCEVFWPLLSNSKHSGSPGGLQIPNFGSVSFIFTLSPKWGCDIINLGFWLAHITHQGNGWALCGHFLWATRATTPTNLFLKSINVIFSYLLLLCFFLMFFCNMMQATIFQVFWWKCT